MTQHDDTGLYVALQPAPCDACVNRKQCANEVVACSAYEQYESGASARVWRFADRTPTEMIARKILGKKDSPEMVERKVVFWNSRNAPAASRLRKQPAWQAEEEADGFLP
jgi:hypothetical protein